MEGLGTQSLREAGAAPDQELHHREAPVQESRVQRHAAAVLTNPDMMTLATEQPALWAELASKIVPAASATQNAGSKKRSRT